MMTYVKAQSQALKLRFVNVGLMHIEKSYLSSCVTIIKVHVFISPHC